MSVWERLHQPKNKKSKILRTRLQYDINMQQEREKKRQAVVFVSSFHPRGGVFCCSWRDGAVCFFFRGGTGRFFFFPRLDGAVVVFFRGGTGRVFFFSEAGRGGFFFFFDGTGRGGVFFFSRAGTGRLFLAVAFFLAGRGKIVTPSRQRRFKPSRQPSMYSLAKFLKKNQNVTLHLGTDGCH